MKRRRWRRHMQLSKTCRRHNVAAPSLASCLIWMSRCRPLFGKKGAQRLIHIRQLRRAISCTEPKRRGRTQARRFAPGALVAGLVAYVGRTSS